MDETQVPPIEGRFISLGKFRFEKDGAGYVLITNEGTTKYVTNGSALKLLPEERKLLRPKPTGRYRDTPPRDVASKQVKKLEADLKKLKKDGPARDLAMAVREDDKVADVQIRVRGVEKQRGETVPRGFLHVALDREPVLSPDESGRRELAGWIASPQNPLTARGVCQSRLGWLLQIRPGAHRG